MEDENKKMYSLPQEIEVWYIIPAIRKELSRVLTKKYKLTLDKVGEIIGVSKAAVCQYLKNKRAGIFKFPKNIRKEIENSAGIMVKDKDKAVQEIVKILRLIKQAKCSCRLCKKYNKGILKQCGMKPLKWE